MSGLADTWAREQLAVLDAQGLSRELEPLESPLGGTVTVGGQRLVNFSGNDFLGLANHRRVVAAAHEALDAHGVGTGASRLVVGDTTVHHALEAELARFLGTEAALLFGSGYLASLGVLPTLLSPGDIVFSDEHNHASLVDSCRLARAQVVVYPHADVGALAALVARHPGRRRVVVTDAIFSMEGDRAPLKELAAVARAAGLALFVDEAHALGVVGPTGRGLSEECGVSPDLLMGTLSKALGSAGAFVASSAEVRRLLISRSRPFIFSSGPPAVVCAAALAALQRVEADPTRRARLWNHINLFARGLQSLKLPSHTASPIFSVVLGSPERALAASAGLRERGFLVKAIRPPSVPEGTSRLHISLSAAHEAAQVEGLVFALGEVLG